MLTVKLSQIAAQRVISSCYIKIIHKPDYHSYQNEYVTANMSDLASWPNLKSRI